ncbi:hypothetical protein NHX12_019358 [Muraenolepis orangiensis]|uniref:Ig-like domain-containing protein n=1 Tax=Muraenolepis orangiensis TaxID=630683 RepID=A0A9Q0IVZ2_9TELE|nr:hypothetical protein NHX12_019358 [Muraenolepis orangiensis]
MGVSVCGLEDEGEMKPRVRVLRVRFAGVQVNLRCNPPHTVDVSWYHFNYTLGEYRIVQPGPTLSFYATVKDSGKYICSHEPRKSRSRNNINLTVVDLPTSERLTGLRVVATPSHPVVMEGQAVMLHCHASTFPPAVNWSWCRSTVDLVSLPCTTDAVPGRDLVVSRPEQSGSDGLPHAENQGDYMNCTRTNLAYEDLEPNSGCNDVYSSLS